MNQLEKLLNTLLEMGWKPYSQNKFKKIKVSSNIYNEEKRRIIVEFDGGDFGNYYKLCDVASINSGLWQFVCENRVVKENDDVRIKNYQGDNECDTNCCYDDYEYRLIESALVPEDELSQFLLDNINIDEKGN